MKRLAAAVAAWTCLAAGADTDWYLQLDNDLGFETDRWYSSGFRFGTVRRVRDYELELGLLHEIYTPDVKGFKPGSIDRMPTARLLLTAARHDRSDSVFQTLEMGIGVRGPGAGGEQITNLIHRVVHARDIDWSRQDRDRVDFQFVVSRTQAVARAVNVNYGAVLGNEVAFAHAGAELRFGLRGPNAPSNSVLRFAASPPVFGSTTDGCWGGFLAASGRVVWRNELLERGYALSGPEPVRRRAIARAAAGFIYGWSGGSLTFTIAHESKEFGQQSRGHTFGSIAGYVDF